MTTVDIVVSRISYYSIGVKLWFVVQSTTGERYQRWTFAMNATDECLMICAPGDTLEIEHQKQLPRDAAQGELINAMVTVRFKK